MWVRKQSRPFKLTACSVLKIQSFHSCVRNFRRMVEKLILEEWHHAETTSIVAIDWHNLSELE